MINFTFNINPNQHSIYFHSQYNFQIQFNPNLIPFKFHGISKLTFNSIAKIINLHSYYLQIYIQAFQIDIPQNHFKLIFKSIPFFKITPYASMTSSFQLDPYKTIQVRHHTSYQFMKTAHKCKTNIKHNDNVLKTAPHSHQLAQTMATKNPFFFL